MRKIRNQIKKRQIKLLLLIFTLITIICLVLWMIYNLTKTSPTQYVALFYHTEGSYVYLVDPKLEKKTSIAIPYDVYLAIPGGYGEYKQSALEEFSKLQKKTDLVKNTYAYLLKTPIQFEFRTKYPQSSSPSLTTILFAKSNASFIDRLRIITSLRSINQTKNIIIPTKEEESSLKVDTIKTDLLFSSFFLNSKIRDENKLIKLEYNTSQFAADTIEEILSSSGMNIVTKERNLHKDCIIVANEDSVTLNELKNFLSCSVSNMNAEQGIIRVQLGNKEDSWVKN